MKRVFQVEVKFNIKDKEVKKCLDLSFDPIPDENGVMFLNYIGNEKSSESSVINGMKSKLKLFLSLSGRGKFKILSVKELERKN